MQAEYQRDYNRNYLILHGDPSVDLGTYPVRMLLANAVPCLLSCREQSFDGEPFYYYDITSRQAVSVCYEKKKLCREDLEYLLPAMIRAIQQMAAFLMSADLLCLEPEYMFMDLEKKELYFCYLPGREKDIREQLRSFMEYLLPKIDHDDAHAVTISYGVYRRMMDEDYLMDQILEEVYLGRPEGERREKKAAPRKERFESESFHLTRAQEPETAGEDRVPFIQRGMAVGLILSSVFLVSFSLARGMGYLTEIGIEWILGGLLLMAVFGFSVSCLLDRIRKKRTAPVLPVRTGTFTMTDEYGRDLFSAGKLPAGGGSEDKTVLVRKERREELLSPSPMEPGGILQQKVGVTEDLVQEVLRRYPVLKNREPGNLEDVVLEEDLTVFGKLPGASDVILSYTTISRIHAKIFRRQGKYYLADLNSRNGTFLNGTMLKGEECLELKEGDEVRLGSILYVYSEYSQEEKCLLQ